MIICCLLAHGAIVIMFIYSQKNVAGMIEWFGFSGLKNTIL